MKAAQAAANDSAFLSAGVGKFISIWLGQLVSLTGTGITAFVVGLWVYQTTGSVTKFASVALVDSLPAILLSPFAGALADRWSRKRAMLVGDTGAALSVLALVLLLHWNSLKLWEVYLATAMGSSFAVLHWPAYNASVSLFAPKAQYGRLNAMVQLGQGVARCVSPFLGGFLLIALKISGSLMVDLATFAFALAIVLLVRFPAHEVAAKSSSKLLLADIREGWLFTRSQGGLLSLLALFAISNFLLGLVTVLVTPMVLAFASTPVLGSVFSIAGIGMLLGGLTMTAWGGPAAKARWVVASLVAGGLCIACAGLRASTLLVMSSAFGLSFCLIMANICTRTIIQTTVPAALQGRVFAFVTMIAWSSLPLAYPLAGPLAEHVFEPLLATNGALAGTIGRIIGVGPGRGIGLLFVVVGGLLVLSASISYALFPLRALDQNVSDRAINEGLQIAHAEPAR